MEDAFDTIYVQRLRAAPGGRKEPGNRTGLDQERASTCPAGATALHAGQFSGNFYTVPSGGPPEVLELSPPKVTFV